MRGYRRIQIVGTACLLLLVGQAAVGQELADKEDSINCAALCLSADCNGNGLDDSCDISCNNYGNFCVNGACLNDICARSSACGQSGDCNGDGVPNECQLTGNDCNGNGFPDDCEGATVACCTGPDSCTDTQDFCCDGLGGVSAGAGSSCSSDVCGNEGLACCKADDVSADSFVPWCDNHTLWDCVDHGGTPLSTTDGCSALLAASDGDGDGVIDDGCDNCSPAVASHNCDFFACSNVDQADHLDCVGGTYDGHPDACVNPFACEDLGGGTCLFDGVGDACDNCPDQFNEDQADDDGDHVGNACDNCPLFNPGQEDCNGNGIGDKCDIADGTSRDCQPNDIPDECDIENGDLSDCDGDIHADICDPDIDNDGILNDADKCDYSPATLAVNTTGLFVGTVRADLDGDCDVDDDDWLIFNTSYQDGTGDLTCKPGFNEDPLCPSCPTCPECDCDSCCASLTYE